MEDAVRIAKQNLVRDLHGTDWFHITFTLLSIQCLSVILKKLNTQTSTEILFSSLYVISITFSPETTPFFVLITNLWILWDYFAVSKADYEKLAVKALQDLHAKRRPYFTNSRSLLLLVTCYAIIAVDFPLFPRIHAKCEDYGKSLMDFGVGLFITSNSLSSRRSFLQNKGVLERFLSGLRGTSLLLIIGLARFVSIRFLNYQEHVSEFGVHWNFFITLSLLHLYASVVCFNHHQSWKAGLVYIFIQQVYLSLCGGSTFILSQHRDSFLSKNKEGVLSLLGYVALYEISVSVSMWFHTARHQIKDYVNLSRDGILIGLLMLFSAMMLEIVVEPVSRRLMNAPYVLAVASCYTIQLSLHVFAEIAAPNRNSALLSSLNDNQLLVFLLANLMTGFVNLTTDTANASPLKTMAILFSHLVLVCSSSFLLKWIQNSSLYRAVVKDS